MRHKSTLERGFHHDQPGVGRAQDGDQFVGRVGGHQIDQNSAGLRAAEMRRDIIRDIPAHDGDGVGLADAACNDGVCEPVRVGCQVTIGDAFVAANQRNFVGMALGALLQYLTGKHE